MVANTRRMTCSPLRFLTSVPMQMPGDIVVLESLLNYYSDAAQNVQCLASRTFSYMNFKQELLRGMRGECVVEAGVVYLNHLLAVQYQGGRVSIYAIVPTVLDVQIVEGEEEEESDCETERSVFTAATANETVGAAGRGWGGSEVTRMTVRNLALKKRRVC